MKATLRTAASGWLIAVGCLGGSGLAAEPVELPATVARVRNWLPPDTTTLLAARDFSLRTGDSLPIVADDFLDCGRWIVCRDLAAPALEAYIQPLEGMRVAWALRGGRNYQTVSAFGFQRSEGCLVLQFAEPLGEAAQEWVDLLREHADAVRTLAGQEVFVFPTTVAMEPVYEVLPWQATYFVLLNADTVLCATSDAYLQELLGRLEEQSASVAFADGLPLWRDIDCASPVWMLHQTSPSSTARVLEGVSWEISSAGTRVVYRPAAGALATTQEKVHSLWAAEGFREHATIEPPLEDSIRVLLDTHALNVSPWFLETLALHVLEGAQDTLELP